MVLGGEEETFWGKNGMRLNRECDYYDDMNMTPERDAEVLPDLFAGNTTSQDIPEYLS